MKYGKLLKLYHVGLFFNNFMPGNVGGDVKKVYDIRMQGGQDTVGAGFTATVFDRLFGLFFITLFALAVGALFFVHDPEQRAFIWPSVWIFLGFCVMFAGLLSRRIGKFFCDLAAKILPEKIETRLMNLRPRVCSKDSIARTSPIAPSLTRSGSGIGQPRYWIATLSTKRMFAEISFLRAILSPSFAFWKRICSSSRERGAVRRMSSKYLLRVVSVESICILKTLPL